MFDSKPVSVSKVPAAGEGEGSPSSPPAYWVDKRVLEHLHELRSVKNLFDLEETRAPGAPAGTRYRLTFCASILLGFAAWHQQVDGQATLLLHAG